MAAKESINSFLFALFGFQKVKNKAHIILIVLIHAAGWCILFLLPLFFYPVRINTGFGLMRQFIDKAFLVGFFYLNYYVLIPQFFEKKKRLTYFMLVLLGFLIYITQHVFVRSQYVNFNRPLPQFVEFAGGPGAPVGFASSDMRDGGVHGIVANNDSLVAIVPAGRLARFRLRAIADTAAGAERIFTPDFPFRERMLWGIPRGVLLISLNNTLSSFFLLLLMSGFIRLAFSFIRNQNEKKALENANLNAEVSLLKSQINPHFLFNTLNGLYSLAHAKSDHTEHAILKLSDILRYVLYDSAIEKIDLAKDIEYISNYIHLQRLRVSKKVTIHYEVQGNMEGLTIAPLLLITFIENAFKYGVSYMHASTINISITVFEETLTLIATNTVFENNTFDAGGIGLKNARRRLDLLYPGKYLLDIVHDRVYVTNLKINLKRD
jgi:two-component system LytT family sensor kinase